MAVPGSDSTESRRFPSSAITKRIQHFDEAIHRQRQGGNAWGLAIVLSVVAGLRMTREGFAEAHAQAEEVLVLEKSSRILAPSPTASIAFAVFWPGEATPTMPRGSGVAPMGCWNESPAHPCRRLDGSGSGTWKGHESRWATTRSRRPRPPGAHWSHERLCGSRASQCPFSGIGNDNGVRAQVDPLNLTASSTAGLKTNSFQLCRFSRGQRRRDLADSAGAADLDDRAFFGTVFFTFVDFADLLPILRPPFARVLPVLTY